MRHLLTDLIKELEQKNPQIFNLDKESSIFPSYKITSEDLHYHISEGIHEQIMVDLDTDSSTSLLKRPILEKIKEKVNSEKMAGTLTEESKEIYLSVFKEIKSLNYEKFSDLQYKYEEGQPLTQIEQAVLNNVTKFIKHNITTQNPLFDNRNTHVEQFKMLGQFHLYETKAIKGSIQDYANLDPYANDIKDRKFFHQESKPSKYIHEPKGDMISTLLLLKVDQPEIFRQISSSYSHLSPNDHSSGLIREMISCSNNISESLSVNHVVKAITITLLERKGLPTTYNNEDEALKFSQRSVEVFNRWANQAANNGTLTNKECLALIKCSKEQFEFQKLLKAMNDSDFESSPPKRLMR